MDNATLKAARQVKSEYDMAMRRIMAQQEINTEFEVWSTFVLSRPRVGSDYKVQETMATISEGLKEQYRLTCMQRAGCAEGKDFAKLGPFAAAMYMVTKEELDIALAECRTTKIVGGRPQPKRKMEQNYMPLISFPWLFEKELGRIATGVDAEDDLLDLGLLPLASKRDGAGHTRHGAGDEDIEDFVEQGDGVIVHRGEELDLFRPDVESDDLSGGSDFEEARSVREDGSHVVGNVDEVVLNNVSKGKNTPADYLSGTGVEDVVPRTQLDGFTQHYEDAQSAQNSDKSHDQYSAVSQPRTNAAPGLTKDSIPPQIPCPSPTTAMPLPRSQSLPRGILMISDDPLVKSSLPVAEDEPMVLEEEEVNLDIEESSLEKLARMMDS